VSDTYAHDRQHDADIARLLVEVAEIRSRINAQGTSNIPIPDPSEITARAIATAKEELRGEFDDKLKAIGDLSAYRYDERTRVLEATRQSIAQQYDSLSTMTDQKLHAVDLQFAAVDMRFSERDVRVKMTQETTMSALSTALASQKELATLVQGTTTEAIQKSETAFTTRISALETLLNATKDGFTDRMAELNNRMNRTEGGQTGAQIGTHNILGIIGGIVGIISLLLSIAIFALGSDHLPAGIAPVGIDSKRVDDLTARLNALSQRLDSIPTSPAAAAPTYASPTYVLPPQAAPTYVSPFALPPQATPVQPTPAQPSK